MKNAIELLIVEASALLTAKIAIFLGTILSVAGEILAISTLALGLSIRAEIVNN